MAMAIPAITTPVVPEKVLDDTVDGLRSTTSHIATNVNMPQQPAIPTAVSETAPKEISHIEEVWDLVNQHYFDRTFNGQDWEQVKKDYMQRAAAMEVESTALALPYKLWYSATNEWRQRMLASQMVASLNDPYSTVLSPQQFKTLIFRLDSIGVGADFLMVNDVDDGNCPVNKTCNPIPASTAQIVSKGASYIAIASPPVKGSPADKAQLKKGDIVTAINGISTKGRTPLDICEQLSMDTVNNRKNNDIARQVTFSIRRQLPSSSLESQQVSQRDYVQFDVTMERRYMQAKNPVWYKVSERRPDGTVVGYIRISEFNTLSHMKVREAISDLKRQGVNAYVLDLRCNGGGSFEMALEISSLFLEDRIALYIYEADQVKTPCRTLKGHVAVDSHIPIVVLLDELSASASEVLTASLHDNCRAVTMGDVSYGKGLMQCVYGLNNGGAVQLTVARYVTPRGKEVQGIGLTPDISDKMAAPVFIPYFGSDTSHIDFHEISKRIDPLVCHTPKEL